MHIYICIYVPYTVPLLTQVRPLSVQGSVDLLGNDLAHPTAVGSPWDPACGNLCTCRPHLQNKSVKGCSVPQVDLSQWMTLAVDHFAPCSSLRGLTYGADDDQRCRADLVSMLENQCMDFQLGLEPGSQTA